jgi:hypothetical protein
VELFRVRVPLLKMPAPLFPVFPEMVEFVMERLPELLKAPTSPEVIAPETVTPEIARLPPTSMLKTPKLRFRFPLSPLMISEVKP